MQAGKTGQAKNRHHIEQGIEALRGKGEDKRRSHIANASKKANQHKIEEDRQAAKQANARIKRGRCDKFTTGRIQADEGIGPETTRQHRQPGQQAQIQTLPGYLSAGLVTQCTQYWAAKILTPAPQQLQVTIKTHRNAWVNPAAPCSTVPKCPSRAMSTAVINAWDNMQSTTGKPAKRVR